MFGVYDVCRFFQPPHVCRTKELSAQLADMDDAALAQASVEAEDGASDAGMRSKEVFEVAWP